MKNTHRDRQIGRRTDRDSETGRQTARQAGRQADRQRVDQSETKPLDKPGRIHLEWIIYFLVDDGNTAS